MFSAPRSRVLAATLGTLLASVLITAGMPIYLPFSQTDNIGIPILLFPVTWVLFFLFSLLYKKVWIVWSVLAVMTLLHGVLIFFSLS